MREIKDINSTSRRKNREQPKILNLKINQVLPLTKPVSYCILIIDDNKKAQKIILATT